MNKDSVRTTYRRIWAGIKSRCLSPSNPSYFRYGGRGIKICERWMAFDNFIADMGFRTTAKHSIDRVDNDGDYEPSNCRWATQQEQHANQAFTQYVLHQELALSLGQFRVVSGMTTK